MFPHKRESIAVDLCAVATHARLEVAASQSACGKVSNKMEAAEWTDTEEDHLILLWQEKACLFNTGLKEFSKRQAELAEALNRKNTVCLKTYRQNVRRHIEKVT